MNHLRISELSSRFFLAPLNTGYANDGAPTDRLFQFHQTRAGHKIGVAYVGNVAVDKSFQTNDGTAVICGEQLDLWRRLAQTIDERGSIPAIQLACRYSPEKSKKGWVCSERGQFIERMSKFVSELPALQIIQICQEFVAAAEIANEAGFRVIQIHAAHGYLLSLLLNRILNKRIDAFGDGCYALKLIADGINERRLNCTLDVRISIVDGLEDRASEIQYRSKQIAELEGIGFNMVSLSAGMYDVDRRMIYPGISEGASPLLDVARDLAIEYSDILWNVSGRLGAILGLADIEPPNLTFSLGRPLIADPLFIEKSLTNRENEIVQCSLSGKCHYFSRGKLHIECGENESV